MQRSRRLAALTLPLALASAGSWADPAVTVSGHGAAAVTWTDTGQAEFARFNRCAAPATGPTPVSTPTSGAAGNRSPASVLEAAIGSVPRLPVT